MVCVIAGILLIIVIVLCVKIYSAREIAEKFSDRLDTDTNTLIDISSHDNDMMYLAESINKQLRILRKEKLRYHQGNAELKNAVTNISHDIRTPLTAVCGYLDMLENCSDPGDAARYIKIMKERTGLMTQLTEELFRYSVIISDDGDMETERVFVNQLLAESITGFYPELTAKGIEPKIRLTDKRIERSVNKAALSRVFSNILSNAVKYSCGDLEITLSDIGEITFSNTARGLSAVETEQLFDRFYTVEAAHHSTGLGLSIARTLIERMGGSITAEYADETLMIRMIL